MNSLACSALIGGLGHCAFCQIVPSCNSAPKKTGGVPRNFTVLNFVSAFMSALTKDAIESKIVPPKLTQLKVTPPKSALSKKIASPKDARSENVAPLKTATPRKDAPVNTDGPVKVVPIKLAVSKKIAPAKATKSEKVDPLKVIPIGKKNL